jgi:hypothetical protein
MILLRKIAIILNKYKKNIGKYRFEFRKTPSIHFDNFQNLTMAYEKIFDNDHKLILPNKTRPKLLARLLGTLPSEAYFIIQSIAKCKDIVGDVCEFGVAQGETSALIANEIFEFSHKKLHLFDSFEGLPKPSAKDKLKDDIFLLGNIEAYTGTMSFPEDMVRNRLHAISFPSKRYVIHKGFIEQLIYNDKSLPQKVCFAYLDFDFYEPIKIALEFLDTVISNGEIIIVDDYDFFSTGVKIAVDEFLESRASSCSDYDFFVPDACFGKFAILTRIK